MTRRTFIVPSIADCVFILALLIVTLVWARPALNTDGDAGRHIRVGETILQRAGLYARYVPSGHIIYVTKGTLFAVPFDLARLEVRGERVASLEVLTKMRRFIVNT